MSLARYIISYDRGFSLTDNHRSLRLFGAYGYHDMLYCLDMEKEFQLVNLRYLFDSFGLFAEFATTSLHLLWNLQTLIMNCGSYGFTAPDEIWNMSQLRHVEVEGLRLPDPCSPSQDNVLENLRTLKVVRNFKWGEEVIKRIPNVRKLSLEYVGNEIEESCFNNLDRLHKLKSLSCIYSSYPEHDGTNFLQKLSFPRSLTKLVLNADLCVEWEDMLENIGSLPLLEKFELCSGFFGTHTWKTVEGQFPSLRFLKLDYCVGLQHWNSESSHSCLEHLVLKGLHFLHEIPCCFTLQSVELYHCSNSAIISCKMIQKELERFHEEREVLRVRAEVPNQDYKKLKKLANSNFEVISI